MMKKDPLEDIIEEVNESDGVSDSRCEQTSSSNKAEKETSEQDPDKIKEEQKDIENVQPKSYDKISQASDRRTPILTGPEKIKNCRTETCSYHTETEVYTIRDAYWERRSNDIFLDNYNTLRRNKNMAHVRHGDRCDSTKVITTISSVVFIVIFVMFMRRGEFQY